jgi:hypothetical protein
VYLSLFGIQEQFFRQHQLSTNTWPCLVTDPHLYPDKPAVNYAANQTANHLLVQQGAHTIFAFPNDQLPGPLQICNCFPPSTGTFFLTQNHPWCLYIRDPRITKNVVTLPHGKLFNMLYNCYHGGCTEEPGNGPPQNLPSISFLHYLQLCGCQ